MLGLPKSTVLSKALPKKALFDRNKPSAADRRLFDEQISRMSIVAEISPHTVAIKASEDVAAVYVVLVTLKTDACDKKNIVLLKKKIDQQMLFILQSGENAKLAVYRAEKVLFSESQPLTEWKLSLTGLDVKTVWENALAEIFGFDITGGKDLDAAIAENDRQEKLRSKIAALEKKAMAERQPRRKWELAEEIKRLKIEGGSMDV